MKGISPGRRWRDLFNASFDTKVFARVSVILSTQRGSWRWLGGPSDEAYALPFRPALTAKSGAHGVRHECTRGSLEGPPVRAGYARASIAGAIPSIPEHPARNRRQQTKPCATRTPSGPNRKPWMRQITATGPSFPPPADRAAFAVADPAECAASKRLKPALSFLAGSTATDRATRR